MRKIKSYVPKSKVPTSQPEKNLKTTAMKEGGGGGGLVDDPVLRLFNAAEIRIAAEFLTNCLPFLSKGLCNRCIQTLGDRIRSLDHIGKDNAKPLNQEENVSVAATPLNQKEKVSVAATALNQKENVSVATTPLNQKENVSVATTPLNQKENVSVATTPLNQKENVSVATTPLNQKENVSVATTPLNRKENVSVATAPLNQEENVSVATTSNRELTEHSGSQGNCDTNSLGSWNVNDTEDTNSLGSWKDGGQGWSEPAAELPTTISERVVSPPPVKSPKVRMSWADMAQEDELAEKENEAATQLAEDNESRQLDDDNVLLDDVIEDVKVAPKVELSRDQREHIRFTNVKRKKDFICLERVNGRLVNILEGLELHCNIFSAVEQKRIVDFVQELQDLGKYGKLKDRTYTAPQKWMRGKGRVTIQFGCCYNYATDKFGNPPGILRSEMVDPMPHLFKVIIRRLIKWHVLPPTCIPDSCIVNVYDEGDCIPPHIDNHDFLRPFCTVSLVSECNIVFGSNLKIDGPGEFSGTMAVPLPVGSVLVFNGHAADVAKHCVPAVASKRISITFRKMDQSKWPRGFAPEPDLQGVQPLSYESDGSTNGSTKESHSSKSRRSSNKPGKREEVVRERSRGILGPEPRFPGRRRGSTRSSNWQRVRFGREF